MEMTIERSKSGEYWRAQYGAHFEVFDHEPTGGELALFRQSIADANRRAANVKLMQVKDRPGRIDGGFEVKRA